MKALRWCLPSALTLLGFALSLWFLLGGPWWGGCLGLACDLADGAAARRLGAQSFFGARLDWSVDTCCAALAAGMLWLPLVAVLPLTWALAETFSVKFSGRSALFFALMAWRLFNEQ